MHALASQVEDKSNNLVVLTAMADYAAAAIEDESAIASARHCLIDALARGFEALREPDCAALIGPIVPGAVMPGGARVPGTSLELEPAQAAFCMTLMLCRTAGGDEWPATGGGRAADMLGAILAAADYQARKSLMEGKPPPRVRDVLAALVKSLEILRVLGSLDGSFSPGSSSSRPFARVTATAITAAQLGGTPVQIIRSIGYSFIDAEMIVPLQDPLAGGRAEWAWAHAMSGAVRHACQGITLGRAGFLTSEELGLADLFAKLAGVEPSTPKKPFGVTPVDPQQPHDPARLIARLGAAVERYFPTRQAERVKALFAAPERLDELPVNELIAALVTNGAR